MKKGSRVLFTECPNKNIYDVSFSNLHKGTISKYKEWDNGGYDFGKEIEVLGDDGDIYHKPYGLIYGSDAWVIPIEKYKSALMYRKKTLQKQIENIDEFIMEIGE